MSEENLTKIPNGWALFNLTEICQQDKNSIKRGPFGSAIKKEFFVPSGFKVYEQKNAIYNDFKLGNYYINSEKFEELKNFEVNPNDIIMSCSGTVGKLAIVPEDAEKGVINQALLKLTINNEIVSTDYFLYMFRSKIDQILLNNLHGSAMKNIASVKELKKFLFPIPPKNEQKRIVNKIEELLTKLDAGIQELTLAKEKLKVYRQSVLKHAFEGKLTEEWREAHNDEIESASNSLKKIENNLKKELGKKYKSFQPANIEELSILPEEWEWATYSQIGDLISGQHIKTQDYNQDSDGMPYLTGPADFTYKHPLVTKWTPNPKAKALKDDVMITVKGAGVGKVNVLDIEEAAISRQLMAIRATEFDQNYIFYYIKSNFYYFQKLGSSSTVPGINRDQILKSVIPVPPLSEQKEIGNEISRIFSLIENMETNIDYGIKQANILRQSILKKAFSGQLVPQDPNDEPAEKLLKRIKAQKEKQKSQRKSKQKRLVK